MQISPEERLFERLRTMPDACRAIEHAIGRTRFRGGGELVVRFHVAQVEALDTIEVGEIFGQRES